MHLITKFLQDLSPILLQRLYQKSSSCLAVFRLLPSLSQQYVLRSLFIEKGLEKDVFVQSWIRGQKSSFLTEHENAIEILLRLSIFQISKTPTQDEEEAEIDQEDGRVSLYYVLTDEFKHGLRIALTSNSSDSFGNISADSTSISSKSLENYATDRWDSVLHFMVGSKFKSINLSRGVLFLLESSGLMSKNQNSELHITSKGFQFLLEDINTQIWSFLVQYLDISQSLHMDMIEMLQFFFMLGCLDSGQSYSTKHLTITQKTLINDLADFGLVKCSFDLKKSKFPSEFYPTKLATTLTIGREKINQVHTRESFLVIETNYRVYAYTNSPLHISVLGLFVELKARFPNMVVGLITRDSIKYALEHGINTPQIINYLKAHAHFQMKKKDVDVIPPTIVDQITLWEKERNRLVFNQSFLYKNFELEEEFDASLAYASDLGFLLWHDVQKRWMVINSEGHAIMRDYIKTLIASRGRTGYNNANLTPVA